MSDSNALFSYLVKIAKENLAKLVFYIIAVIVGISFLKWLIYGGFSIVFGAIFGLFGGGHHSDKDTIKEQQVVIEQVQQANQTNTTTIGVLQQAKQNTEESLQNHFTEKEKRSEAFDDVLNKGRKAFNQAYNKPKTKKAGVGNPSHSNPSKDGSAAEPPTPEPDALEDPFSPESLELASAQFTMVQEAYCLASQDPCN